MSFSFHQLSKKIQNRYNHHEHRCRELQKARLLDDARGEINTHGEERPQKACHSNRHEKPNPKRHEKHAHQRIDEGINGGQNGKQQDVNLLADRVQHLASQRPHGVDEKLHRYHEHHRKDHILSDIGKKMRYKPSQAMAQQSHDTLAEAKHDGNPNLLRRLVVGFDQAHRARHHAGREAEDKEYA